MGGLKYVVFIQLSPPVYDLHLIYHGFHFDLNVIGLLLHKRLELGMVYREAEAVASPRRAVETWRKIGQAADVVTNVL